MPADSRSERFRATRVATASFCTSRRHLRRLRSNRVGVSNAGVQRTGMMKKEKKITLTERQRELLEKDLEQVVGGAVATGDQVPVDVPAVHETIDAAGAAL